jgi:hypothetical protein
MGYVPRFAKTKPAPTHSRHMPGMIRFIFRIGNRVVRGTQTSIVLAAQRSPIMRNFHTLAAARGDGLLPELQALFDRTAADPRSEFVVRADGMIQCGPAPASEIVDVARPFAERSAVIDMTTASLRPLQSASVGARLPARHAIPLRKA